ERPGVAAVGRLVESTARAVRGRIDAPGRAARLPHRGVDHARGARLEGEVDRAGVRVVAEDALPRHAAVFGAIDAALRVRAVRMPERGDVHEIRIGGMDDDAADLLRVGEADVRPRLAGVGRLVHA